MKKCAKCLKDFKPIDNYHKFCPACWDKIYRELHPEEFIIHRVCKDCKTNIDYQPDGFKYCPSCWAKLHNKSET